MPRGKQHEKITVAQTITTVAQTIAQTIAQAQKALAAKDLLKAPHKD